MWWAAGEGNSGNGNTINTGPFAGTSIPIDPTTGQPNMSFLDDFLDTFTGSSDGSGFPSNPADITLSSPVYNVGGVLGLPGLGGTSGTSSSGGGSGGVGSTGTGGASSLLTSSGLGTLLNGLLGYGNAALNTYGADQALAQQSWINSAKSSASGYAQGLANNANNAQNYEAGQVLPGMTQLMNNLNPAYTNGLTQGNNALQAGFGGLNAFTTPTQTSQVPGLQGVFDQLGGLQGYGNSLLGSVAGNATGTNPTQASALAAALGIGTTQNPLNSSLSAGNNLLNQNGNNALTNTAQQVGINSLLNNGQTPLLNNIDNLAQQSYSPTGAAQTAINAGSNIVGQNPLLSMGQVASMATDQSATQSNNLLNSLRQQLLNRTGVTGPAVASGQQNQLLDQLGDQALQNQASSLTNALTNQQNLQLGLYGQGANLLNSGGQQQLTSQQQALSSLLGGSSQALQNQTGLGQLGLGGLQGVLQSLSTGGNLTNQYATNQLGGLNTVNGLLGTQNNATNSISNLLGTTGGLTNQAGQDVFGLQNLGLQQNSALYSALNSLISGNTAQNNNILTGLNDSASYPENYALAQLGQIPNYASDNTSLFTGGNGNNPQNFFNNLLSGTTFANGGVSTGSAGNLLNSLGITF